jgi:hypothetical protein
MTTIPHSLTDSDVRWVLPMRNFSGIHRFWRWLSAGIALIFLIFAWTAAPVPFLQYFIGGLLGLFAVAIMGSLWNRVERTELDFVEGTVAHHFWLRSLRRPAVRCLAEFEIVISDLNIGKYGANWISVALSGRNGSFELARFEPDEALARDQADARLLRERLAKRLSLRNIGVV